MIYGIGIDIIKVERMREAVERWGERFLRRVFTDDELARCFAGKDPYPSLSVRFAAKEACIKAIGSRESAAFRDIEVVNDEHGKPGIAPRGRLTEFFERNALGKAHLSLSHERDYGIAFVVIEKTVNE
ncbi:MAG: holo-ACP synthase [Nitrospirae bacterium]|nr:holo-ACP synthase [Nitrospirota bacterium]